MWKRECITKAVPHLTAWLVAIVLIAILLWVTFRWFRNKAPKHRSKHPHAMEAFSRKPTETGNGR
jgi:hypothetical protein